MDSVAAFNPLLQATETADDALRIEIARRTLENIIESYHRNYDVFAELLQNAVDACQQRYIEEGGDYTPKIWVTLNLHRNEIAVCDNGVGMSRDEFEKALAPNVSFKDFRQTPAAAETACEVT